MFYDALCAAILSVSNPALEPALGILVYLSFSSDIFSFRCYSTSALVQILSSRLGPEMD